MASAEIGSFLEVPEGTTVKVTVDGLKYDLGHVEKVQATSLTYVVWSDRDGRVWYESSDRQLVESEEFHRFWNRYQLTSCRSVHNLKEQARTDFLRLLSSAIASGLERQFSAASEALDAAEGFLETANERVSRTRYTVGAVSAFAIGLVASGVLYSMSLGSDTLLFQSRIAILGGSIGALLSSLSGRTRGLGFDPDASVWESRFNGALRVLYGVASAFVVVIAVKSEVVSTSLITPGNESLALIVVAVAGGFGERLAADLIKRFSPAVSTNADQ